MMTFSLLCACSNDSNGNDEPDVPPTPEEKPADMPVTTPVDESGFTTYYTPSGARVGDPMPFYDQKAGDYKVLYLYETDHNAPWCYHPFYGVSTSDGGNYSSLDLLLPTGKTKDDLDAALGTGCAVYDEAKDEYQIYYTGHAYIDGQGNREVVMRATSSDFKTWTKDTEWVLKGQDYGYSVSDFRDPQVFKDDNGLWHMIIATQGSFAEFTSTDLDAWKHLDKFSFMYFGHMLECPDVFKMGDWWYLVFSDAYRSATTRNVRYMKARTLDELKACLAGRPVWPDSKEGVLDSRAFYAGKTASDGRNRYIWGWCPFRQGMSIDEKNLNVGADSEPNWSGALVCHKIIQHEDGTLTLAKVPGIEAKYAQSHKVEVIAKNNAEVVAESSYTLAGSRSYVLFNRLGNHNHISMSVTTDGDSDEFGISFMRGTNGGDFYSLVVSAEDDGTRKVNFAKDNMVTKTIVKGIDSYKFASPADKTYSIDIFTDNSVVTMYINDVLAYTQRIYGIQNNGWSVNAYGGKATVKNVKVMEY